MYKLLLVALALVFSIVGAVAQMPGTGRGSADGIIQVTPKGYFALRDGVLVKFDMKTLAALPPVELFGPAPKAPEGDPRQNAEAYRVYAAELGKRSAPAIMLAKDDAFLIVIGTTFFRVNQDTLKVEVTRNFANPNDTATTLRGALSTPAYNLVENEKGPSMLFLLMPRELIVLDVKSGETLGRSPLPEAMQPRARQMGGQQGGQQGGQRGQRGAAGGERPAGGN